MSVIVLPEDTIRFIGPPIPSKGGSGVGGSIPGPNASIQTEQEWNTVILGSTRLPGIASIEGLGIGVDVETKKAKGSDQNTSKDNGLDPTRFTIILKFTGEQLPEFQAGLPAWNPRRPGRERSPMKIVNPWVQLWGIQVVRILNVSGDSPTAKGGFEVKIKVEEWFDAPKATAKEKAKPPIDNSGNAPPLDVAGAGDYDHVRPGTRSLLNRGTNPGDPRQSVNNQLNGKAGPPILRPPPPRR